MADMDCKDLVIDGLNRVAEDLQQALEGVTPEQLVFRPGETSNPMGWLAWHLARVQEVGEAVDDRHGRVLRQLLDLGVREGANHDPVDVAREHARRVGDRLAAA